MSIQYGNPPLVELIAELRWGPAPDSSRADKATTVSVSLPRVQDDEVLMYFGMLVAKKGYDRVERLVPSGIPLPPHVIACRFRPEADRQSPLYQVGKGIFTVNALPPDYQSWDSFCPIVRDGVDFLIDAHRRAGEPIPNINQVLVRYIDVFNNDLTGGRSVNFFMSEVLGVHVTLPTAITRLATAEVVPSVAFSVPVEHGVLRMVIGGGAQSADMSPLLDTTVLIQRAIGADVDLAVEALSDARTVIHNLFLELTAPIHEMMRPMS